MASSSISRPSEPAPSELRILRATWEKALPDLLARGRRVAVGQIRRPIAEHDLRIVTRLDVPVAIPDGTTRPKHDEFCIVAIDREQSMPVGELVHSLRLQASQSVTLLVVSGRQLHRYRLFGITRGQVCSLDRCTIVGEGMLQLPGSVHAEAVDGSLRFSRTRGGLGDNLFRRLQNAVFSIVGAGGTGSQLAFQSAALGVRSLRLVDGDILGVENLNCMPGLHAIDCGKPKVAALAESLVRFQPELGVSYVDSELKSQRAVNLLNRPCDLMISAVDNDALGVSILANRSLTPHLDVGTLVRDTGAGTRELTADIRLLLPGMCLNCVGGLEDREATLYDLAGPPGSLQRGRPVDWNDLRAGSLVHWNAMVCGHAMEMYLAFLRGERGACWTRLRWHNGLEVAQSDVSGGTCEFCNEFRA